MKIKRSSWHYKISNFGKRSWDIGSDNLCLYFWRMVFKVVVAVILFCFVSLFCYTFWTEFDFRFIWLCFFYAGFVAFVSWLAIHLLRERLGKSPEIPGGNIIVEYLKAKKEKVCPLIEYI